jgi:hypothetical protein
MDEDSKAKRKEIMRTCAKEFLDRDNKILDSLTSLKHILDRELTDEDFERINEFAYEISLDTYDNMLCMKRLVYRSRAALADLKDNELDKKKAQKLQKILVGMFKGLEETVRFIQTSDNKIEELSKKYRQNLLTVKQCFSLYDPDAITAAKENKLDPKAYDVSHYIR